MKNKKLFAFLVFMASISLSVVFLVFADFFKGATSLGLLGLFLINFTSNATLFLPTAAFVSVVAAGNLYPAVLIAIVSSLGAVGGDTLGFLLGISSRHLTLHKLEKHVVFLVLEKNFKRHATWVLFLFSFVPNPFFDAVGLLSGIFKYSFWKFFLVTFIGRVLRFYLFAKFGSYAMGSFTH